MKTWLSKNWILVPLIAFGLIVYRHWLTFNIYATSDWPHYPVGSTLHKLLPAAWVSFYNIGTPASVLWRFPFEFPYGVFALFGHGSNVAHPFVTFLPMILSLTLGGYFLVKKITGSVTGAAVGSLIVTYNTYNLASDTQGHYLLPLAAGYAVLALWIYFEGLDRSSYAGMVLSGLLLSFAGYADFRIAYIMVWVLLLYIAYDLFVIRHTKGKQAFFRRACLLVFPFIIFGLLNVFWVATVMSMGSMTDNIYLNRGLFGEEFWSLLAALTLFHPFWTGGATAWFETQTIPWFFWITPIVAFCGFWVGRKQPRVVFFYAIALIGIFLTKQRDAPWGHIYSLLFEHLPGFGAFREATKFYFLISLGYAVLIGSFVSHLIKGVAKGTYKKIFAYGVIAVVVLPFLWNAKPIFNREVRWMSVPREVTHAYQELNPYIHDQSEFFRVIEIPFSSGWLSYDIDHPTILGNDLDFIFAGEVVSKSVDSNDAANKAVETLRPYTVDNANEILDAISARYVIVVPQYNAEGIDVYESIGIERQLFLKALDRQPYLKRIDAIGGGMVVYENEGAYPRVHVTGTDGEALPSGSFIHEESSKIIMVKRGVNLYDLESEVLIQLSEQYHGDWKVRIGSFNWLTALLDKDYFLPDSVHLDNEYHLNSFILSPEVIRAHADKSQYEENADGSINARVTLYFRPQSVLNLSSAFSGAVAVGSVVYVAYAFYRRRKKNIET